jgi:hypothetical protein
MKTIKKIILVMALLPILSCEDEFIERTPTNAISATAALSSPENMQLVLNGVHRSLYAQGGTVFPGGSNNRAGEHWWVPMGDNIGGGLIHSADANNLGWRDNMQWNDHTIPTSETNEMLWYHRYNTILHANLLINGIPESGFAATPTLNEILGQAYTYRAYAYLSLVQHYGKGYLIGNPSSDQGVPLVLQSGGLSNLPRSTVEQVYVQIGQDLDAAIAAFTNGTGRIGGGAVAKSQLNINVAHGLKARWALNKGDYTTAASSAVAARTGFPLMNEADWKSGFNTNNLSEVIWGSHVIATETTFFRAYFYLASNTFNGSQIRTNPKIADRRVVNAIPSTDYRRGVFINDAPNTNGSAANAQGGVSGGVPRDPNYSTVAAYNARRAAINAQFGITNSFNLHPYMHFKLKNANPGGIDPDDIILMRSAEMYLIEAEAKAMLPSPDVAGARAALTALVSTRDTGYNAALFTTPAELMAQIKFQRRVELYGEGFSYTDRIRWDDGIDHSANGGSGASQTLYQNAYIIARPSINDDWIFKIPQAEIDANANIGPGDQN